MDSAITIQGLQAMIRKHDYKPEQNIAYFLKLTEEVGELADVIRRNVRMEGEQIKGTIEEELYDVLYYTLALANVYGIDLEQCHQLKAVINREKHGTAGV